MRVLVDIVALMASTFIVIVGFASPGEDLGLMVIGGFGVGWFATDLYNQLA